MAKSVLGRGTARDRVLEAAMALFGEHGVNGTSLQMIADRLGVGKAAVYYQFHSKDDIVAAAAQPLYDDIARLVTIAEAVPSAAARRQVCISGLIEMCVRHRRLAAVLYSDPAVESLVQSREDLTETVARFNALLYDTNTDISGRVVVTLIVNAIYRTVIDPALTDVSDTDMHRVLLESAQQLLRTATLVDT